MSVTLSANSSVRAPKCSYSFNGESLEVDTQTARDRTQELTKNVAQQICTLLNTVAHDDPGHVDQYLKWGLADEKNKAGNINEFFESLGLTEDSDECDVANMRVNVRIDGESGFLRLKLGRNRLVEVKWPINSAMSTEQMQSVNKIKALSAEYLEDTRQDTGFKREHHGLYRSYLCSKATPITSRAVDSSRSSFNNFMRSPVASQNRSPLEKLHVTAKNTSTDAWRKCHDADARLKGVKSAWTSYRKNQLDRFGGTWTSLNGKIRQVIQGFDNHKNIAPCLAKLNKIVAKFDGVRKLYNDSKELDYKNFSDILSDLDALLAVINDNGGTSTPPQLTELEKDLTTLSQAKCMVFYAESKLNGLNNLNEEALLYAVTINELSNDGDLIRTDLLDSIEDKDLKQKVAILLGDRDTTFLQGIFNIVCNADSGKYYATSDVYLNSSHADSSISDTGDGL